MTTELTKEQEGKIQVYIDKYLKIGMSTEQSSKEDAENAIIRSYEYMNRPIPEIIWASSPLEGAKVALRLLIGDREPTEGDILNVLSAASYGSFEAYWVSFYSFIFFELEVEKKDELIDIVNDIVKHCGVYWTFEDTVVLTPKPIKIFVNEEGALNNSEGLALEYPDGWGIYAINGEIQKSLSDVILKGMINID
jgi:hypothetical protein